MGDDAVNTAHKLIRMSRGLAGFGVEVGVIAGALHEGPARETHAAVVETVARGLDEVATNLRGCAVEMRGGQSGLPRLGETG